MNHLLDANTLIEAKIVTTGWLSVLDFGTGY